VTGTRCCRVQPDLLAVERAFDYSVPDGLAPDIEVGTIVRIPLHGRRVRGWVVADPVTPTAARARVLLPITGVASAGPPAEVVALCEWVAWRWAGPLVPVLRAASPPTLVAGTVPPAEIGVYDARPGPDPDAADLVAQARARTRAVIAWPPRRPREPLAHALLADEGSTIVVAPDPSRTHALVEQLADSGREVVMLHAGLPARERSAAWDRARGGACIVVGGRTAVLAPVPDLAALIVIDEGDDRLTEQRVPTWNAREIALERADRVGARVTLVGAAPSLTAVERAGAPLRLSGGAERSGWPRIEAVDPRDEPRRAGLVTDRLVQALRIAVANHGRAVCVLNRRGRARLLACTRCGELARCDECGAAMADADGQLVCALGDAPRARTCVHCGSARLRVLQPGVSHVRTEVAGLLPRVTVAEVDAGTDAVPAASIAVGTEAVLHRLPTDERRPVLLVAFLDFDQELLALRYQAAEQALGLLARAARLLTTGAGRLLVQTRIPDHEVIRAARSGDPTLVTAAERPRRARAGLPPFGGLAELTGGQGSVSSACATLGQLPGLRVLGPLALGGTTRALVQAPTPERLADAISDADLAPARAQGRLRVAVDPPRV
jgi:primosomal protein N' (replication factor Y)